MQKIFRYSHLNTYYFNSAIYCILYLFSYEHAKTLEYLRMEMRLSFFSSIENVGTLYNKVYDIKLKHLLLS